MEYLDFLAKVNSDDPELYIQRGEDETPYPRGYFDNVIEKLDYIEHIDILSVNIEDNGDVVAEYRNAERYMSFQFLDPGDATDNNIIGYLAVGAWTNERYFNINEAIDQMKNCVDLLKCGSFDDLKKEWVIIRKG